MISQLKDKLRRAEKSSPDSMTLVEHLTELRRRVVKMAWAYVIGMILCFVFYQTIFHFLEEPYCSAVGPKRCTFYVTAPLDGLSLRIKISAYGGLFLSSPVLLWQLWRFITPGLHQKEKRYAVPFLVSSLLLFLGGAAVAYISFPHALQFLDSIGGPSLKQIYNPNAYLGLIVAMMAIFGATFEVPVLLVSLELAGALTPETLSSWRRWAIIVILLGSAIITPSGDPFSMFALAVPLYVFYEGSIIIGRILKR
jgi:sec-independent protein translocase protein TatC